MVVPTHRLLLASQSGQSGAVVSNCDEQMPWQDVWYLRDDRQQADI
jgi:hypothetical protein